MNFSTYPPFSGDAWESLGVWWQLRGQRLPQHRCSRSLSGLLPFELPYLRWLAPQLVARKTLPARCWGGIIVMTQSPSIIAGYVVRAGRILDIVGGLT